MPILNVTISKPLNPHQSADIAATLSALTQQHLRKDPSLTAVALTAIAPEHWYVGGASLAAQDKASFWLDIKVVDGTNTKPELAAYQEAVFTTMSRLLGPLHQESYILVHEVPAAAYGFGGKTQEHRYIAGRLQVGA